MERKDIGNEKERTCNNKRGLHVLSGRLGEFAPRHPCSPRGKAANSLISSGSGR